MKIDKETYWVGDENHYKTQQVKKQIIISNSLRKDNYHILRLKHKEYNKTKKWNTFTISREGVIFQHYDTKYHSDFLGIKNADIQSISIVLENMGCLFDVNDEHINWLNEVCPDKNVGVKKWMGYDKWEKYSPAQLKSLINLTNYLIDELNIERNVIDFMYYHKDVSKFKGVVFHSNYVDNSSNVNGMFNLSEFNTKIMTK